MWLEASGKRLGVSRELVQEGSKELAAGLERGEGGELACFLPVADQPLWDICGLILGVT